MVAPLGRVRTILSFAATVVVVPVLSVSAATVVTVVSILVLLTVVDLLQPSLVIHQIRPPSAARITSGTSQLLPPFFCVAAA
ncbi:hypothetical protein D3C73_1471360 [compost metagenome]